MKGSKVRDSVSLKNSVCKFLAENHSGRKLVVINSYDRMDAISRALRESAKHFGDDTDILLFKSVVPDGFPELHGAKVLLSERFLESDDMDGIDRHVFSEISKNWDRAATAFPDAYLYRGIELARISDYELRIFLLFKIKALAVLDKVIKKNDYRSVLLIDSNDELCNFDRFLCQAYKISAQMISPPADVAFFASLKARCGIIFQYLLDSVSTLSISAKGNAMLIDARLFKQLSAHRKDGFVPVLFEGGSKIRVDSFIACGGYVAFRLERERRGNFRFPAKMAADPRVAAVRGGFKFKGIDYWELVRDKIAAIVFHDFKRFRSNIDKLAKVKNRLGVKKLVIRNDLKELEKTLVLASKDLSIKTLVAQHGILAEPNGHDTIHADKLAAWGDYAVTWYGKYGNDKAKIAVVGNPAYDNIVKDRAVCSKADIAGRFDLKNKGPLVSLFTTGIGMLKFSSFVSDDITENLIQESVRAVCKIGNVNMVVKLHPNEDADFFQNLIDKTDKDHVVVTKDTDLRELISASNLVITIDSTVGLDAVILRKPLITVNLGRRPDLVPYAQYNVALGVYSQGELESAISKCLYDADTINRIGSARDDFLRLFLYRLDGGATERVLNLIEGF